MPTKWLHDRPNGSKNVLGIGFEGPGVETGTARFCPWFQFKVLIISRGVPSSLESGRSQMLYRAHGATPQ